MNKCIFFENVYGCPDTEYDLSKIFNLMNEYGFTGIQIPYDILLRLDKDEFKHLLGQNKVELVCTHVVSRLFASDDEVFHDAIDFCKEALRYISHFGCRYFMPTPFCVSDADSFSDKEGARKRFAQSLELISQEAEKYGVKVIIENISQTALPFSTVEDIEYLLCKVPSLHYCFDTGNFVCTGTDAVEGFEMLKDKIEMVHVKDFGLCKDTGYKCNVGYVGHVDFGKGKARLFEVMKKLTECKPDIPYIIEIHSTCPEKSAIEQASDFFDKATSV